MRIAINFLTLLRHIQNCISLIIKGFEDCLSNSMLTHCIQTCSSYIPGLHEEYWQLFHRSGIIFRYTSNPLSCQCWWSQICHHMSILYNGQFWHAATHYEYMFPLQARHWTMPTHFVLPFNGLFCFVCSIFLSFKYVESVATSIHRVSSFWH